MKLICPPPLPALLNANGGNFNFIIHTFGYRKVCYPSILIKPKIFLLAQAQANTLAFKYEVNIRPPWWGWLTQIINVLIIGCFGCKTKNLNNRQKKGCVRRLKMLLPSLHKMNRILEIGVGIRMIGKFESQSPKLEWLWKLDEKVSLNFGVQISRAWNLKKCWSATIMNKSIIELSSWASN